MPATEASPTSLQPPLSAMRNGIHHPLFLSFYLPSLIFDFSIGLLLPILPLYVADYGVSYGVIGLVLAAEPLGRMLGDIPAGLLLGHIDRKWVMLGGLSAGVVTTGLLFAAPPIALVFLLRLLAGAGIALYNVARHKFITDMTPVAGRGRAIALLAGIFRIGGFIGPAAGGFLAAMTDLRTPFLLSAIVAGVTWVLILRHVAASHQLRTSPRGTPAALFGVVGLLRTQAAVFMVAGSAQTLAQMTRAGRQVLIPLYAADVIGLSVGEIGLVVSVAAAVDTALFYPAGLIMDLKGRKWAIVPCFLIQGVGLALMPLSFSFASLLLVGMVIGAGNGLGSGTMMTLGADLAPPEMRGQFLGVWRLIGDMGFMGGPLITGTVADVLVLPAAAVLAGLTGMSAASLFAFGVPETLQREEPVPAAG